MKVNISSSTPSALVSLVTYNTGIKIKLVIESIISQTYKNIKLIVSDNGSTDNTLRIIDRYFPNVEVIHNQNIGYAKAHNLVLKKNPHDFLLALNDDCVLDKNYIAACISHAENNQNLAAITGIIYEVSDLRKIDKNKRALDFYIITKARKTKPVKTKKNIIKGSMSGVTGTAVFLSIPKLKLLPKECFDEDFFMYYEDIDLCWRLNKLGFEVDITPNAYAYHLVSYSFRKRKSIPLHLRKLVYRNRYFSIIKNENSKDFILNLPFILGYEIMQFFYLAIFDLKCLSIYLDVLQKIPYFFSKREKL
jgi:GT2 family glycosyltransferase